MNTPNTKKFALWKLLLCIALGFFALVLLDRLLLDHFYPKPKDYLGLTLTFHLPIIDELEFGKIFPFFTLIIPILGYLLGSFLFIVIIQSYSAKRAVFPDGWREWRKFIGISFKKCIWVIVFLFFGEAIFAIAEHYAESMKFAAGVKTFCESVSMDWKFETGGEHTGHALIKIPLSAILGAAIGIWWVRK